MSHQLWHLLLHGAHALHRAYETHERKKEREKEEHERREKEKKCARCQAVDHKYLTNCCKVKLCESCKQAWERQCGYTCVICTNPVVRK